MSDEIIRIRLKAFDARLLDLSVRAIVETVRKSEGYISGPVPLPTETRRYTVIRSPHVNKDSREQFEIKIHKRLIDILEPTKEAVESLMKMNLPSSIDVEIKSIGGEN